MRLLIQGARSRAVLELANAVGVAYVGRERDGRSRCFAAGRQILEVCTIVRARLASNDNWRRVSRPARLRQVDVRGARVVLTIVPIQTRIQYVHVRVDGRCIIGC